MADEPDKIEKLNEFGRTPEEEAERERAEELAAKIEAVLKDQSHKATMDALGNVLRGISENYPGRVLPTAQPESPVPQDQPAGRSGHITGLLQIGSIDFDLLAGDQFAKELESWGAPLRAT